MPRFFQMPSGTRPSGMPGRLRDLRRVTAVARFLPPNLEHEKIWAAHSRATMVSAD